MSETTNKKPAKDISELSRKGIKKRIRQTQKLLVELELELEKREQERDHDAVDHIDDYMEETDQSILSLLGYVRKLLAGEKKEK